MLSYEQCVFELRRQTPIGRRNRPPVVVKHDLGTAQVHHRLDGDHHPLPQTQTGPSFAYVWHARLFVHLPADAVAAQVTYDRTPLSARQLDDGCPNVAEAHAITDDGDASVSTSARGFDDVARLGADLSDDESPRRITVKTVEFGRDVDVDDVTFDHPLRFVGDAMTNDLVAAGAHCLGETMEPELAWTTAASLGVLSYPAVDVRGYDARFDLAADVLQSCSRGLPGAPQLVDLLTTIDVNHHTTVRRTDACLPIPFWYRGRGGSPD